MSETVQRLAGGSPDRLTVWFMAHEARWRGVTRTVRGDSKRLELLKMERLFAQID
jgi:hypothetical protein